MFRSKVVVVFLLSCLLLGQVSAVQADRAVYDPIMAVGETWKASPVGEDCAGSIDADGRSWYEAEFDDSSWTVVALPDSGAIPSGQDRYYRLRYHVAEPTNTEITLSTDDGAWLYVNGQLVGQWGGDCQGEGGAEDVAIDIGVYLQPGDNLVAVHVHNGPGDSSFNLLFPTTAAPSPTSLPAPLAKPAGGWAPLVPFLDLPYDYKYSSFTVESSASGQGGGVSAYFDHQSPTSCSGRSGGCSPSDTNAVQFNGYDGGARGEGQAGFEVFYNGHSGTDYMLGAGRAVLAAADGIVIFAGEIPSVCSDGRVKRANVIKVQHANGYTTEYWHLSSFAPGIEVGSAVSRDPAQPIGYAGNTGCTTGPHLHFAVYNPSHVAVDPYGWSPEPDTPWYGHKDPWKATSRYLWVHPLAAEVKTSASAPAVAYSTSALARVTVPATAYSETLRVELAEGLPRAVIPGNRSLHTLSVAAYTAGGAPVLTLLDEAVIDVRMPAGRLQRFDIFGSTVPALYWWNPETACWQEVPTTWDPGSRIASAPVSRLGTFALSVHVHSVYLPAVSKNASHGELAARPPARLPVYRPRR
ncbi:MAG: M23 family metallopeptidase [Anaerolineae bacterium]|nr:M23 family metallopeptidase [Anaerolineae bacterium]